MKNKYSESQVLELASYTGKVILQNGGEVYRVERCHREIRETLRL